MEELITDRLIWGGRLIGGHEVGFRLYVYLIHFKYPYRTVQMVIK